MLPPPPGYPSENPGTASPPVRRFRFNALFLIFANGLENLVLLLLNLTLVRIYGTSLHGHFVYYISLIVLAQLFLDFGLNAATTQKIAANPRNAIAQAKASFTLVGMCSLPVPVIAIYASVRPDLPIPALLGWFALWYAASTVRAMSVAILNGLQRMDLTLLVSVISATAMGTICIIAATVRMEFWNLLLLANGLVFLTAFPILALVLFSLRSAERSALSVKSKSETFRLGLWLWIPGLGTVFTTQMLILLVHHYLTERETSLFSILFSWSAVGFVFLFPLSHAFFSWSAAKSSISSKLLSASNQDYFRIIGITAFGIALFLWTAAEFLLSLYGTELLPYRVLFGLLIASQFLEFPRFFSIPFLGGRGGETYSTRIETMHILASILAVALALYLTKNLIALGLCLAVVNFIINLVRLTVIRTVAHYNFFPEYFLMVGGGILAYAGFLSGLEKYLLPTFGLFMLIWMGFRYRRNANYHEVQ